VAKLHMSDSQLEGLVSLPNSNTCSDNGKELVTMDEYLSTRCELAEGRRGDSGRK